MYVENLLTENVDTIFLNAIYGVREAFTILISSFTKKSEKTNRKTKKC